MPNLDNLKPFAPGQSGNPGGRKRGAPSIVKALIKEAKGKAEDGTPYMEGIAKRLLAMALGDYDHRIRLDAMKLVMERLDGKVSEHFEHSGPDGAPMRVENLIDLSRLTDADLDSLECLVGKAASEPH